MMFRTERIILGLKTFEHQVHFNEREMEILYTPETFSSWTFDDLDYATGRVPWYLNRWVNDAMEYSEEVCMEIRLSLEKLRDESKALWDSFELSSIHYLLKMSLKLAPVHFDRKYLRIQRNERVKTIVPLFPLVEEAYRGFFWDKLMKYNTNNASDLLNICFRKNITQGVRGHLFEQIVIARLFLNGLTPKDFKKIHSKAEVSMTQDITAASKGRVTPVRFQGMAYPVFDTTHGHSLHSDGTQLPCSGRHVSYWTSDYCIPNPHFRGTYECASFTQIESGRCKMGRKRNSYNNPGVHYSDSCRKKEFEKKARTGIHNYIGFSKF